MNLGVYEYGQGLQIAKDLRARGLQMVAFHTSMGKMGTWNYGRPMSLSQRLVSRGRAQQVFGIGREKRPWYEAFFEHMERMAPVMSSFVLQLYGMYGQQRQSYWNQQSSDKREAAYLDMMKDMVGSKTGQRRQMDQGTYTFIQQQLRDDPNRSSVLNNAARGNPELAQLLDKLLKDELGEKWYKKPVIVIGLAGVALVGGLALANFLSKA